MPPTPRRRAETGLHHRKPKRQATANERWLHLGAGEASLMFTLHVIMGTASLFCSAMHQLLALIVAAEGMVIAHADLDVLHAAYDSVAVTLVGFLGLLRALRVTDELLFDIPPDQEDAPLKYTRARNLRIDDLSDMAALKMTHFNHSQLRRLYELFDLESQLEPMSDKLAIPTGFNVNGTPCRYRIHPEEVFLFTLCKVATGMTQVNIVDNYFGGDKTRWVFAYPWMLRYLDTRYQEIVGHQGLTRFVDDFPRFHRVIEDYVQRDPQRELIDGTMTIVPGINFLPWDVFGFIDDSIDRICTPFSGPRGDYEGAARKEEYADSQQAFFTGYIHAHGIKVETVFLPNGLCTLFGPVSARRADAGVLRMSNLNEFLVDVQRGRFATAAGDEVFYSAFGDLAFKHGMQCIQSYYHNFTGAAQLDGARMKCNASMRAVRVTIENSYAMVSNLFRICGSTEGYKIAKRDSVALEQLRVCILLTNCYICLNGDQAGSVNTFNLSPPSLEDYLVL